MVKVQGKSVCTGLHINWVLLKKEQRFYEIIDCQHLLPHVLTQAENTLGPYLPGQPDTHFSRLEPGHALALPSLWRSASDTRVLERVWEILFVADGRGLFFREEGLPFLVEFLLDGFFLPLSFSFAPFLALLVLAPPFLLLPALGAGACLPPPEPESEKSQVCLFSVYSLSTFCVQQKR